jgi:glycosyltransferase involved in cell wall biosynthesis
METIKKAVVFGNGWLYGQMKDIICKQYEVLAVADNKQQPKIDAAIMEFHAIKGKSVKKDLVDILLNNSFAVYKTPMSKWGTGYIMAVRSKSKEIKISVIMPIYNGEKYLRPCLDCFVGQTFRDFELICVNDCSDDSTAAILAEYQAKDGRIVTVGNEKRLGAGMSRNIGIGLARGDYLYFSDADDLVELDMLEAVYAEMTMKGADFVEFSLDRFTDEEYSLATAKPGYTSNKASYGGNTSLKDCPSYAVRDFWGAAWNKLYAKKFILTNQLEFQDLPYSNDLFFTYMAFMIAERRTKLDSAKAYVHYRIHSNPMRVSVNKKPLAVYQGLCHLQNSLIERGYWPSLYNHYYIAMITNVYDELHRNCHTKAEEDFYDFMQKEGTQEIYKRGGIEFAELEPYTRVRLKKLMTEPYDSRWWEEEALLNVALENSGEIVNLAAVAETNGARVGIWGAGARGKAILNSCQIQGLKINMFIDIKASKQASTQASKQASKQAMLTSPI